MKKTLVVGASPNSERYGFKAVEKLIAYGHPVYAYGIRKGTIGEISISNQWPTDEFDTVTIYLNPYNQLDYYDRILALNPKRVIFNPGTENPEFENVLRKNGIEAERACTLVLLGLGQY